MQGCKLLVPNGSLQEVTTHLLEKAGFPLCFSSVRANKGKIINERLFPSPYDEVVRMRPQDMPMLIARNAAQLAITGEDLVEEARCGSKVEKLATFNLSRGGVGYTQLMLAVPHESLIQTLNDLWSGHVIATEFPNTTKRFLTEVGKRGCVVERWHGSVEAARDFADAIVELSETGTSLKANGFRILHRFGKSQTCLIASKAIMKRECRARQVAQEFALLLRSVISARGRVKLQYNVHVSALEPSIAIINGSSEGGSPTISDLANGGKAVEIVLAEERVEGLLSALKEVGATLIMTSPIDRLIY